MTVLPTLVAAMPASVAAATSTIVHPTTAPLGAAPTTAWFDPTDLSIHDGDTTLVLGSGRVQAFRSAVGGYVVQRGTTLTFATNAAETTLTQRRRGDFRVSTGTHPGRDVAFSAWAGSGRQRHLVLHVLNLATDRTVGTLRPDRFLGHGGRIAQSQVLSFHAGRVWTNLGGHLATWDPATGHVHRLALRVSWAVDPAAGIVALELPGGDYSSTRFVPLRPGASWKPWVSDDGSVVGWSPDGRVVATTSYSDEDGAPLWVTLADARTGQRLGRFIPDGSFHPYSTVVGGFEGDGSLLVDIGANTRPYETAIMRLGTDGTVERTTDLVTSASTGQALPALPR